MYENIERGPVFDTILSDRFTPSAGGDTRMLRQVPMTCNKEVTVSLSACRMKPHTSKTAYLSSG